MWGEMIPGQKKWTWALCCSIGLLKKNNQLVDVFHIFFKIQLPDALWRCIHAMMIGPVVSLDQKPIHVESSR